MMKRCFPNAPGIGRADGERGVEVLDTLPPKYRAVVHLHYVEGYSTEEIAEIAKCRPSTVRSRLRRARAQLKTLIEQEESHEAVADGRVSCFDGGNREPEYGA